MKHLRLHFRLTSVVCMLLTFAAIGLCPIATAASTYYIAANGNDSNSGSQSAPFRQFNKALSVVHPGDTIFVGDGTYNAFVVSNIVATAAQPLVIQAQGSNAVINADANALGNIDVESCAYVTVSGFKTYNGDSAGIRVNQSNHVTVQNCVTGNNDWWGIFTRYADHVALINNETYGSVNQHGIYVSNSADFPIVRGNYSHDNAGQGIQFNGDINSGAGSPGGLISVGGGQTTVFDGIISGALVENNRVCGNNSMGVYGDGLQDSTIRNNLIYNNAAWGISLKMADGGGPPQNDNIYNNTIVVPLEGTSAIRVENLDQSRGGINILNNILYTTGPTWPPVRFDDGMNGVSMDYNAVTQGSGLISPASWSQSWSGSDQHSVFNSTLAQLFVLPFDPNNPTATLDLHLKSGAPVIDKGLTLTQVPADFEGNPRPQGASSDIGAYEYSGKITPTLALNLSPTTVTGGSSTQGTVTLSPAAPASGAVVTLSSNNAAATVPASITVASGQTSATFSIGTKTVTSNTAVTILSAAYNGLTKTTSLTVQAPAAPTLALSVNPTTVTGGSSAQGTVTLSPAAPASGAVVTLSSNNKAAIVSASVAIAAGQTSATFSIGTKTVTSNTAVTISAAYNGLTKAASLTVQAPAAPTLALSVNPTTVPGGSSAQGTVTLSPPAPASGAVVTLSSNNAAVIVPANVAVAAGQTSATFSIGTKTVASSTTVTISAAYSGLTKTASLTVQPAARSVSTFVMGVNLGGNAVTIEGNSWLSYSAALAAGLSVSNAQVGETGSVTYSPAVDSSTGSMLDWGLWTRGTANGVGFTLKQSLPKGTYDIYVWEVEDDVDHARNFNLLLQGTTAASNLGDQLLGQWMKYGPYIATVKNGVLQIDVVRNTKGDPQLMGLAIFREVNGAMAASAEVRPGIR